MAPVVWETGRLVSKIFHTHAHTETHTDTHTESSSASSVLAPRPPLCTPAPSSLPAFCFLVCSAFPSLLRAEGPHWMPSPRIHRRAWFLYFPSTDCLFPRWRIRSRRTDGQGHALLAMPSLLSREPSCCGPGSPAWGQARAAWSDERPVALRGCAVGPDYTLRPSYLQSLSTKRRAHHTPV